MDFQKYSTSKSAEVLKNSPFTSISKNLRLRPNLKNAQISRNSRNFSKIWKIISGHLYREISKISKSRSRFSGFGLKPRYKNLQNSKGISHEISRNLSKFPGFLVPKMSQNSQNLGSRNSKNSCRQKFSIDLENIPKLSIFDEVACFDLTKISE